MRRSVTKESIDQSEEINLGHMSVQLLMLVFDIGMNNIRQCLRIIKSTRFFNYYKDEDVITDF